MNKPKTKQGKNQFRDTTEMVSEKVIRGLTEQSKQEGREEMRKEIENYLKKRDWLGTSGQLLSSFLIAFLKSKGS